MRQCAVLVNGHIGEKHVVVLTNRNIEISEAITKYVTTMNASPREVIEQLKTSNYKHLYIDGVNVIQGFLRDGLINELIITRISVLLGSGISLFGELHNDIKLQVISSESYSNSMIQTHYKVL